MASVSRSPGDPGGSAKAGSAAVQVAYGGQATSAGSGREPGCGDSVGLALCWAVVRRGVSWPASLVCGLPTGGPHMAACGVLGWAAVGNQGGLLGAWHLVWGVSPWEGRGRGACSGSLWHGRLGGGVGPARRVPGVHPWLLLPPEVLGFCPNSQARGTGWRQGQHVPRSGTARLRPSLLLSSAPRPRSRGKP